MPGLCQAVCPATVTVPREGDRKPEIRCSSVDLPAPFGPSRPVTPGPMVIVMSLTATTLPYQWVTLSSTISAGPPARAGRRHGRGPGGLALHGDVVDGHSRLAFW